MSRHQFVVGGAFVGSSVRDVALLCGSLTGLMRVPTRSRSGLSCKLVFSWEMVTVDYYYADSLQ